MSERERLADVFEAKSFVVRDHTGKVRAQLAVDADGSPSLQLYDVNGVSRAMIGVGPDGSSGLQLTDGQGKARVILCLDRDQPNVASVTLALNGKADGGISLWVSEDGLCSLDFIGLAGEILLELPKGMRAKTS